LEKNPRRKEDSLKKNRNAYERNGKKKNQEREKFSEKSGGGGGVAGGRVKGRSFRL